MALELQHCVPCEGGIPPMEDEEEDKNMMLIPQWTLHRDGIHKLTRKFRFEDFVESIEFVKKIAILAEQEQHHPNIRIVYNLVEVELYTHAIKGLSLNDFILASKINQIRNQF